MSEPCWAKVLETPVRTTSKATIETANTIRSGFLDTETNRFVTMGVANRTLGGRVTDQPPITGNKLVATGSNRVGS